MYLMPSPFLDSDFTFFTAFIRGSQSLRISRTESYDTSHSKGYGM